MQLWVTGLFIQSHGSLKVKVQVAIFWAVTPCNDMVSNIYHYENLISLQRYTFETLNSIIYEVITGYSIICHKVGLYQRTEYNFLGGLLTQ